MPKLQRFHTSRHSLTPSDTHKLPLHAPDGFQPHQTPSIPSQSPPDTAYEAPATGAGCPKNFVFKKIREWRGGYPTAADPARGGVMGKNCDDHTALHPSSPVRAGPPPAAPSHRTNGIAPCVSCGIGPVRAVNVRPLVDRARPIRRSAASWPTIAATHAEIARPMPTMTATDVARATNARNPSVSNLLLCSALRFACRVSSVWDLVLVVSLSSREQASRLKRCIWLVFANVVGNPVLRLAIVCRH